MALRRVLSDKDHHRSDGGRRLINMFALAVNEENAAGG